MSINSKKGFTIIEVVLVLAIAGLIFLMVFIALPTMQRNQRDTQRRNDYSALSTSITNYMTNNNGRFPAACDSSAATPGGICKDTTRYINNSDNDGNKKAEDPSGNDYVMKVVTTIPSAFTSPASTDSGSIVYIVQGADCSGSGDLGSMPSAKSGSRNFAVYGQLESGTYCLASQ